MISGRETLGSIDKALQLSRQDMQELDARVRSTGNEVVRLRQEKAELYASLAKLRMGQLERGEMIGALDAADLRAKEILEMRSRKLDELEAEIAKCHQRQTELETRRAEQVATAEAVVREFDAAEAATQANLAKDPAYQQQLAKAHGADDIARQAEDKTGRAENDRVEKGKPYEADPLFMYLWTRGYGTSKYSANTLARALDSWVAKLCRYADARPNYWMLGEIPARLGEHARQARAVADGEFAALKALEVQASAADGLPARQAAVDQAHKAAAEIDAEIAREEERYRGLMNERSSMAGGQDELARQGIAVLSAQMQREDIVQLRREAQATQGAEDNAIVGRLADIEEREAAMNDAAQQARQAHEARLRRLGELEETRRQFKQRRYDNPGSTFANGDVVGVMLGEFLRGLASSGDLWRTIERQQRQRPMDADPNFGSGGFGFPGGGTWGSPSSSAPSAPPSSGSGGGGKDGFYTGGGF